MGICAESSAGTEPNPCLGLIKFKSTLATPEASQRGHTEIEYLLRGKKHQQSSQVSVCWLSGFEPIAKQPIKNNHHPSRMAIHISGTTCLPKHSPLAMLRGPLFTRARAAEVPLDKPHVEASRSRATTFHARFESC